MPLPLLLAPLALKFAPVTRILKSIPRWAWIAIAVVAILLVGSCVHKKKVKAFGEERYAAGVAHEQERLKKEAERLKAKIDAQSAQISKLLKERNDEENRAITRAADDLRLRGPGKASCPGHPGLSASPGRSNPSSGQGGPAVAEMPPGERIDLIGLPFAGTVALAQQCDLNRAEAQSWREWHKQQSEAWARIGR